ncbi:MAG: hypothetical protein ACNA7M_05560 [Roseovarius sp.]
MNKITTFAAAAALAVSAAAPVLAEEAKTNADPFVSTQGQAAGLGMGLTAGTVAGIVAGIVFVAAIASADGSSSSTTTN